eukprot:scaffold1146_cov399-Prasinococcus_capsulatus_cf.AAC.27
MHDSPLYHPARCPMCFARQRLLSYHLRARVEGQQYVTSSEEHLSFFSTSQNTSVKCRQGTRCYGLDGRCGTLSVPGYQREPPSPYSFQLEQQWVSPGRTAQPGPGPRHAHQPGESRFLTHLLNEIYVCEEHAPTAVAVQVKSVQSISAEQRGQSEAWRNDTKIVGVRAGDSSRGPTLQSSLRSVAQCTSPTCCRSPCRK